MNAENLRICGDCEYRSGVACIAAPPKRVSIFLRTATGCPLKKFEAVRQQPPSPPVVSGSDLWRELHACSAPTPQWFAQWLRRVPYIGGCRCSQSFAEILKLYPPVFRTAAEFFAWGVKVHNMVNVHLNKPVMSLDAARAIYGR